VSDGLFARPDLSPDDALRALSELFSKMPKRPNLNGKQYILEFKNGLLIFRRDEVSQMLDEIFDEVLGNSEDPEADEIVPEKLARMFPGSFGGGGGHGQRSLRYLNRAAPFSMAGPS